MTEVFTLLLGFVKITTIGSGTIEFPNGLGEGMEATHMPVDLSAELVRKIYYMVLQMRYPYAIEGRSARAPRRRRLLQPPFGPGLAPLGLFTNAWPRWQNYINIRIANDQRRGLVDHYIMTGSLINRLRKWIRRAIGRIARRRLYDNDGMSPNPVPTYGVRYPD